MGEVHGEPPYPRLDLVTPASVTITTITSGGRSGQLDVARLVLVTTLHELRFATCAARGIKAVPIALDPTKSRREAK